MSGVQDRAQDMKERIQDWWAVRRAPGGGITRLVIVLLAVYLLVAVVVGMIWSQEPDSFNVNEVADLKAEEMAVSKVRGFTTITTLMEITDTLLHKNGGYLSNDVFPPGLWLDNIPNWEFGALVQVRDFSRALRKDFSRSQSQSKEDPDLQVAEPQFHFDNESWAIPSTEAEYERGLDALNNYLIRLSDPKEQNAPISVLRSRTR